MTLGSRILRSSSLPSRFVVGFLCCLLVQVLLLSCLMVTLGRSNVRPTSIPSYDDSQFAELRQTVANLHKQLDLLRSTSSCAKEQLHSGELNEQVVQHSARTIEGSVRDAKLPEIVQRQCPLATGVLSTPLCKEHDLECLKAKERKLETMQFASKLRHTMCTTSAKRCSVNVTRVRNSQRSCLERRFDRDKDKLDMLIPWVNLSETGYFDVFSVKNFESLRNAYEAVGARRQPFSEVVFSLRSFEKFGLMKFVNRVFLLYDDDQHGPPTFLKEDQDKVVAFPLSSLVAGTAFVNRRRRMHASMAFAHKIPNLSEWLLFMPDDVVQVRDLDLGRLFDKGGKPKAQLLPFVSTNMVATVLLNHFGNHSRLGGDYHSPFVFKRCFAEEIEAEFCEKLFVCSDKTDESVCEFAGFHFQMFVQNFQALREGSKIVFNGDLAHEIHTNDKPSAELFRSKLLEGLGKALFLNLQGPGISDDYEFESSLRIAVDEWYTQNFPHKAGWEKP